MTVEPEKGGKSVSDERRATQGLMLQLVGVAMLVAAFVLSDWTALIVGTGGLYVGLTGDRIVDETREPTDDPT